MLIFFSPHCYNNNKYIFKRSIALSSLNEGDNKILIWIIIYSSFDKKGATVRCSRSQGNKYVSIIFISPMSIIIINLLQTNKIFRFRCIINLRRYIFGVAMFEYTGCPPKLFLCNNSFINKHFKICHYLNYRLTSLYFATVGVGTRMQWGQDLPRGGGG